MLRSTNINALQKQILKNFYDRQDISCNIYQWFANNVDKIMCDILGVFVEKNIDDNIMVGRRSMDQRNSGGKI